ncbi:MAG: glycosyltransferase [Elusimicrobia bacterium]|nr:glycosyltransferase [Elusimicrobiota bacterium]MBP9698715.1 glycosyltransferase [Elusimicrobiota bacterium]
MSRGVLHINTERGWRGGERQTFLLAVELARRGYRNTIAARPGEPLAVAALKEGLAVLPVRPWGEWDPVLAYRLAHYANTHDLSILHAHTGHAVGLGALAKKMGCGRFRLVATRRVDTPLAQNPFSRWKYAAVDGMAVVATAVGPIVVQGGVAKNKIRVIHSGVNREGYPTAADRDRLRLERGLAANDLVVLTAGALVNQKDQATFLRAAQWLQARIPTAKFVICGEGPLRPVLEKMIVDLGLSGRAFLWGHRTDVVACTALADVFVLSSVAEGIGGALIDAMAVEVPTAATRVGGLADLYGSPNAVELTSAGDAEALAKNILWVLKDPAEAGRRVEQGRQTSARFTARAMADGYETLYNEVWGTPL